jgi:hypothetical protein
MDTSQYGLGTRAAVGKQYNIPSEVIFPESDTTPINKIIYFVKKATFLQKKVAF